MTRSGRAGSRRRDDLMMLEDSVASIISLVGDVAASGW